MIKYSLRCKDAHAFEAWFANSAAYDVQVAEGQVVCPQCGSDQVGKALMAPSVVSGRGREAIASVGAGPVEPGMREALELMRRLKSFVQQNAEYVGPRFAEEALKIHHEETDARGIYGEASESELKTLQDEGVDFYPLPVMPEEHN
jgi:hypothetical protein